jgi:L-fuculose-phosphate aldolase
MQASTDLVQACRKLAADGLVIGTAGNVSLRSDDTVLITASGASFATITEAEVSVVDLEGNLLSGLVPTSELSLHLGIYNTFGAGAVVHTHAPAATAVSCVCDELPLIHYALLSVGGAVPVAEYATFGTQELADNVVAALAGKSACLMANHGAITHSSTLDKAMELMEVLEWGSDLYARTMTLGAPRIMTDAQIQHVIEAAIARSYGTPRAAT